MSNIKEWKVEDGVSKMLDMIEEVWDYGYGSKTVAIKDSLELHTGGWSDNEAIIADIEETMFWKLYGEKWERGGHYWFKLPT